MPMRLPMRPPLQVKLMCSWALVCDVWFLEPQARPCFATPLCILVLVCVCAQGCTAGTGWCSRAGSCGLRQSQAVMTCKGEFHAVGRQAARSALVATHLPCRHLASYALLDLPLPADPAARRDSAAVCGTRAAHDCRWVLQPFDCSGSAWRAPSRVWRSALSAAQLFYTLYRLAHSAKPSAAAAVLHCCRCAARRLTAAALDRLFRRRQGAAACGALGRLPQVLQPWRQGDLLVH